MNVTKASCKFLCGSHSKYLKGWGGRGRAMLNWERVKSKDPYACKRKQVTPKDSYMQPMIVRVRYTWLRNLGARKKTQMNEV